MVDGSFIRILLLLFLVCIHLGRRAVPVDPQEDAHDGRIGKEVCNG